MSAAKNFKSPTIAHDARLTVSRFDQVSSLIVSLLILLGAVVLAMFVLVMSMRKPRVEMAVPVNFVEVDEGYGRGDHEAGTARDAFNSQVDEIDEFMPPATDDALTTVGVVINADMTLLDNLDDRLITSGTGKGKGDSRPPGPLGEGNAEIVPRWERWQVRFASADLDAYAKQLDFFQIELAAMGGGKDSVDYASNLALPRPTRRSGPSAAEKRLYMTWRSGELIEADKALLAKAGVDTVGRIILQFYSPQTEAVLAGLEQKQLGSRNLKEIKRTVFGIRGKPGAYEFYVISQEYRFAP